MQHDPTENRAAVARKKKQPDRLDKHPDAPDYAAQPVPDDEVCTGVLQPKDRWEKPDRGDAVTPPPRNGEGEALCGVCATGRNFPRHAHGSRHFSS